MTYRLIEEKDLAALIELRASTRENSFSREALGQIGVTEESVAAMLKTTHRGWLCEEGGRAVGFAMGDEETGELWVIAVLPDVEGRGIGSHLLALVEEWLWSCGWRELWLWTSADPRKRAYTFYLKHGWVVFETKGEMLSMKKKRPGLVH